MAQTKVRTLVAVTLVSGALPLLAQHHHADTSAMIGAADAVMSGPMSANAKLHQRLTPTRRPSPADSVKALAVAGELRTALAKYQDTAAAVADGYQMFMPQLKTQRIYHFTRRRNALLEAFRFDPARPTSLLYRRGANGNLELVGGMYTAPKNMRLSRLDDRIPLSIASWHQHVNWCVPRKEDARRWLERKEGAPVFGPDSPIVTKRECDAVNGVFHENVFGWMLHANVFLGDDLKTVFAHEH